MASLEKLEQKIEDIRAQIAQSEEVLEAERLKLDELAAKSLEETGHLHGDALLRQDSVVNAQITRIERLKKWLNELEQ